MGEHAFIEYICVHCIDFIMVEEEHHLVVQGEENDLFALQKSNKKIILKQRLAFKHNLSQAIVDVGKQVRTGAGLTGYDNTFSTLP